MFERFTERARQVVVLAQDEARTLKHNYIGTEHLLLGLLREEEGIAAGALESLGITLEEVRAQVARIVGSGEKVTSGQIPFTPRAKKVLELSLREALSLGHNWIGTEHVLLGLVRENDGVAARILLDFDADAEKLRNEVIRALASGARHPSEPSPEEVQAAREAHPDLAAELDGVTREKEQAIDQQEFERAASLREQERRLFAKLLGLSGIPEVAMPRQRTFRSGRLRTVSRHGPREIRAAPVPWRGIWAAAAITSLASGMVGLLVGWLIWG